MRCLRLESKGLQAPQMSLAPQPDPKKGLVEDLLYFLTADDNPSRYALGFDRLAAWVDNSLDQYQVLSPWPLHEAPPALSAALSAVARSCI